MYHRQRLTSSSIASSWSSILGALGPDEHVHHLNEVKHDNRLDNLVHFCAAYIAGATTMPQCGAHGQGRRQVHRVRPRLRPRVGELVAHPECFVPASATSKGPALGRSERNCSGCARTFHRSTGVRGLDCYRTGADASPACSSPVAVARKPLDSPSPQLSSSNGDGGAQHRARRIGLASGEDVAALNALVEGDAGRSMSRPDRPLPPQT